MFSTSAETALSRRIGICCSTSCAACRPRLTSSATEYLLFGAVMTVCAASSAAGSMKAATEMARRDFARVADVMTVTLATIVPIASVDAIDVDGFIGQDVFLVADTRLL